MGTGRDPSGLGRWCWARFRGRSGMVLRIVSAYCPCEPNRRADGTILDGDLTVYKQHQKYLNETDDDRDPRTAFLQDFESDLASWLDTGDQILVQGDFNHHILDDPILSLFERHNMYNLIFALHDHNLFPPSSGRGSNRTVDGIFGTSHLVPIKAGYLDTSDQPGDHYPLWVDISISSCLGHRPTRFAAPKKRRLQLSNAKCVARYQKILTRLLQQNRLFQRQYALETKVIQSGGAPLTEAMAKEANAIDNLRTQAMLSAERQCRKFRTGEVDYSPATAGPAREMRFWHTSIRKRQGLRVHYDKWKRLKRAAGIFTPTSHLSVTEMEAKFKEARLRYFRAKPNHKQHRLSYLDTFAPKERDRYKRVEGP